MARNLRTLRDLKEALQELPDHHLDTTLEVWMDDELVADGRQIGLCLSETVDPALLFHGVGFKDWLRDFVIRSDELSMEVMKALSLDSDDLTELVLDASTSTARETLLKLLSSCLESGSTQIEDLKGTLQKRLDSVDFNDLFG